MTLHTPYMIVAARALARALRALALPLALTNATAALAQPADPADPQPGLAFSPCPDAAWLECASLEVPLRHDVDDGRTVQLAVARIQPKDPSRRLGVLFVHPGGHESGVAFLRDVFPLFPRFQAIAERFDVVSLDPRGTGRSRPLHCDFDLPPPPAGEDDATQIAYFDDFGRRVARQCLDQDPQFVRSITGNNFARDIETLRRALDEEQLSFVMASNSGPVAAVYASLFPKHVRAMLLDSPVGPEHRDYWIERRIEQGGSYERTLQRLDQLCARIADCPLEDFGVVKAFDEISARLTARPLPLPGGGFFTAEDFALTFFSLLPREQLWAPTVNALAGALNGDLSPFIGIAQSGGEGDDGIVARLCNDYGTRRTAADYLPITEAAGSIHPRFLNRPFLRFDAAMCAAWPPADPPIIRNAKMQVPALTFHSEFDSDAPFAWSQRLGQAMGDDRHVVRYQGGGHGVIDRAQPCIADAVDGYLFDLRLPREGLACPAEVAPPSTSVASLAPHRAPVSVEAPFRPRKGSR
jgi:pimeloyl-ACP methyl ester carboxylesterase